jgi:cytochrome c-type biogenesis protein CcsB
VSIYSLAGILYLIFYFVPKKEISDAASRILRIGIIAHTLMIILRTYEAERAPFQSLYESLSWFAWSALATYIYIEKKAKVKVAGFVMVLISVAACLYALLGRKPDIRPLFPSLQSAWFEFHVILAFLSYAVFMVSFGVEVTYMFLKRAVANGRDLSRYNITIDNIEEYHQFAYKLVMFGYPLLTFGIVSGAMWANQAWGRYWSWDPKETWSLITWVVYGVYVHAMFLPRYKGRPASWFNILGFICMIMTFLGVNWLAKLFGIPSIHVYSV